MANPPVFLALAAVKHEPLLLLGEKIGFIQDALRKVGFAGPVEIEMTGELGPDAEVVRQKYYTIFTPEQNAAYTFNEVGIFAYHTSAYTTREDLFAAVRVGLNALCEYLPLTTMSRVGVRMLDLIRPADSGHVLKDYLRPQLLGFHGLKHAESWRTGNATMEQRLFDDGAEVIARAAFLPDGFGISADLFATVKAHRFPERLTGRSGIPHCILDLDSGTFPEKSRPFNIDQVLAEMAQHKDRISKLFYEAVTPLALKEWGLRS